MIFDGKRNDIGSTAAAYAAGILGAESPWHADALTVSPYLGDDSLEPFIETAVRRTSGVFVLVKTSNPGGRMLQDLPVDGRPLYRHVADYVERRAEETAGAGGYGVVGAVVGATYPRNWPSCVPSCRTRCFSCPALAARAGRPRRRRRIRRAGPGGGREQFAGHHLCPPREALLRPLPGGALARGGRGGHPRHDRPALRRHAGQPTNVTRIRRVRTAAGVRLGLGISGQ